MLSLTGPSTTQFVVSSSSGGKEDETTNQETRKKRLKSPKLLHGAIFPGRMLSLDVQKIAARFINIKPMDSLIPGKKEVQHGRHGRGEQRGV